VRQIDLVLGAGPVNGICNAAFSQLVAGSKYVSRVGAKPGRNISLIELDLA